MKSLILFDPITVSLPEKMIYRRLGYKRGVTQMTPQQDAEIKRYMADALADIHLKGVALRMPILERSTEEIKLGDTVIFQSRRLAAFLQDSREVVIMAATAGCAIMEAIRSDTAGANLTRGVVLDATASEMADGALDWIAGYFNQALRRENRAVTKNRFSAGYGDFALTHQCAIHALLNLESIGITITDSFMLVPEKSVTAIAGIIG
jgi:hypothetical protein